MEKLWKDPENISLLRYIDRKTSIMNLGSGQSLRLFPIREDSLESFPGTSGHKEVFSGPGISLDRLKPGLTETVGNPHKITLEKFSYWSRPIPGGMQKEAFFTGFPVLLWGERPGGRSWLSLDGIVFWNGLTWKRWYEGQ